MINHKYTLIRGIRLIHRCNLIFTKRSLSILLPKIWQTFILKKKCPSSGTNLLKSLLLPELSENQYTTMQHHPARIEQYQIFLNDRC